MKTLSVHQTALVAKGASRVLATLSAERRNAALEAMAFGRPAVVLRGAGRSFAHQDAYGGPRQRRHRPATTRGIRA